MKEFPHKKNFRQTVLKTRKDGSSSTTVAKQSQSWTDYVDGGFNPGWRDDIAAGRQAGTFLSGYQRTYKSSMARVSYTIKYPVTPPSSVVAGTFEGNYFISTGYGPLPSEVLANNLALEQYVAKASRYHSSFQGGVFLGELGETLRLLKSPLRAIRTGLDDYLGALRKRTKSIPKSRRNRGKRKRVAEETWLEYAFGWAPLFNDIKDAHALLTDEQDRDERKNIFGVGRAMTAVHGYYQRQTGGIGVYGQKVRKHRTTVKYFGQVGALRGTVGRLARVGLSPNDFLPTAWELVPWSFLVDYFTNVGEIVRGASFASASLNWTMKTVINEISVRESSCHPLIPASTVDFEHIGHQKVTLRDFTPGRAATEQKWISRNPYYGSFIPTLRFEVPGMGLKWANLFALSRTHRRMTPFY